MRKHIAAVRIAAGAQCLALIGAEIVNWHTSCQLKERTLVLPVLLHVEFRRERLALWLEVRADHGIEALGLCSHLFIRLAAATWALQLGHDFFELRLEISIFVEVRPNLCQLGFEVGNGLAVGFCFEQFVIDPLMLFPGLTLFLNQWFDFDDGGFAHHAKRQRGQSGCAQHVRTNQAMHKVCTSRRINGECWSTYQCDHGDDHGA